MAEQDEQSIQLEDTSEEILKKIEKEAELEDVVPDELRKDVEEEIKKGSVNEAEKEEDIYTKEAREEQLEDDEISAQEEGFVAGEEEELELGDCSNCGKSLSENKPNIVSKEINKNRLWFCCKDCMQQFEA